MRTKPQLPPPTTEGLSPLAPVVVRRTGCLTPGCDGEHRARGLCRRCYRKAYYRANRVRQLGQVKAWRARQKEGQ